MSSDELPLLRGAQAVTCVHCGKPLSHGEARWAGDPDNRPWHYDCAEAAGLTTHSVGYHRRSHLRC